MPLATGTWRGELALQGQELPFLFQVTYEDKDAIIHLINDAEKLRLDSIRINGDSIYIPMHIFDTGIKAVFTDSTMTGVWIKNYVDDYQIPFKATLGITDRFKAIKKNAVDIGAKWEMTIIPEEEDTINGIGLFEQQGQDLSGTIITVTGDYRYLSGVVSGDSISLSTFDGDHAYLFKGKYENDTLRGSFWSGKSWHARFYAIKNENAILPDADTLTYLKKGHKKLIFSFPDLNGNMISPEDYRGKILIVQLFGSWCPNCMDETKFLAQWYDENKDRGVEILALAYEAKDDFDYARKRVRKMKKKFNAKYDFVIAGTKDKEAASKTLPALNRIISFPTTIFLDRHGRVRRVHTGFTGPGSGEYYQQFIKEFNETVNMLLDE